MRVFWLLPLMTALLPAEDFVVFREPASGPREQLTRYLNTIGLEQLKERDRAVASVATREQAEQRKKLVRDKILRLIGGLPEYRGPLNVKPYGALDRGDYRIEKIVYESLAGFYVTANVYVPARGSGPFPAVLMPVGHGRDGKGGSQQVAVGLALKGFIALAYDPIGQGERLQYYDPVSGASRAGGATDEHSLANGHTMLIGDNVARYRIWDGMRGIDYLQSRADVDARRIGCTGCSGGGTLTTYISALDDRVKAAAPACYINSWQELLTALGPQDAEQSFPGFVSEGLNIADYIELFAPKPWLIVSTIGDFFPLEGARQAYEESKRWYRLYDAADRVQWHIGPGGHGWPQPSREAIYSFFIQWLKNGEGNPHETAFKLSEPEELLVTKTGQVADSLGGETVFSINRKRAADLLAKYSGDVERLKREAREAAAITIEPGGAPLPLTVHRTAMRTGYRVDVVSLAAERGIQLPGLLLAPDGAGRKPAVLAADPRAKQEAGALYGDLEDLVRAGFVVFALQPRGIPETPVTGRASLLGEYGASMRAAVVGKSLAGMRAEDLIRGVDYLVSRPDVDRDRISALGRGSLGVPLLHAALLDGRIGRLFLEDTLASYRSAVERPIHRNLYDVAIPGVLRRYDLDHLVAALGSRPVTVINPADAGGNPVRLDDLRKQFGSNGNVRFESRGRRDAISRYLRAASL